MKNKIKVDTFAEITLAVTAEDTEMEDVINVLDDLLFATFTTRDGRTLKVFVGDSEIENIQEHEDDYSSDKSIEQLRLERDEESAEEKLKEEVFNKFWENGGKLN